MRGIQINFLIIKRSLGLVFTDFIDFLTHFTLHAEYDKPSFRGWFFNAIGSSFPKMDASVVFFFAAKLIDDL